NFITVHREAVDWANAKLWKAMLPEAPRYARGMRAVARTVTAKPSPRKDFTDASDLTARLKAKAAELGLSAIGIAPYDRKYTFAEYQDTEFPTNVIVCVLEQNYEATQQIPHIEAEFAVRSCYATLLDLAAKLASFLHANGFTARAATTRGTSL